MLRRWAIFLIVLGVLIFDDFLGGSLNRVFSEKGCPSAADNGFGCPRRGIKGEVNSPFRDLGSE